MTSDRISVCCRFYAELNDFLPPARRMCDFQCEVRGTPAVKDLIEALGVPHTEVDLVLVDGASVAFSHLVRGGERISVYPVFEALDITPLLRLRPRPLRRSRFIADANLGRLARYLRLCGFDTGYRPDYGDAELVELAAAQGRVILTRDLGVLKRRAVTHGYYVRATRPRAQIVEVLQRFDLGRALQPFSRCLRCNGRVEAVAKARVAGQLPPRILAEIEDFRQCQACARVYWQGSHYERMRAFVAELRGCLET